MGRSMESEHEIIATVKTYILKEFLPGEDPDELDDTTPLITGGILDSISTMKLVASLEEHFGVEFHPHEIIVDNLNTLSRIARIVEAKLS